jgi:hypothetical protein
MLMVVMVVRVVVHHKILDHNIRTTVMQLRVKVTVAVMVPQEQETQVVEVVAVLVVLDKIHQVLAVTVEQEHQHL